MSLGVADIDGKEVCSSQELVPNLSLDDLSSCHISPILGNRRTFETSLGSVPVFMVLQKSETLLVNTSYCRSECHHNT